MFYDSNNKKKNSRTIIKGRFMRGPKVRTRHDQKWTAWVKGMSSEIWEFSHDTSARRCRRTAVYASFDVFVKRLYDSTAKWGFLLGGVFVLESIPGSVKNKIQIFPYLRLEKFVLEFVSDLLNYNKIFDKYNLFLTCAGSYYEPRNVQLTRRV